MKQIKLSFDQYYREVYADRWPNLKIELNKKETKVMRPLFSQKAQLSIEQILTLKTWSSGEPLPDDNFYVMDPASVIAASFLDIGQGGKILDMCAAPGGKSLILLEKLQKSGGILWSNEISAARREKLKNVIRTYVPEHLRERIFIKGKDGTRYGITLENEFDAILVDAPCSGERHLLHDQKELAKWSVKRTKRLAKTQYSLLCSALLAVKPSGHIIYSTCSLSPLENDDIIERILEKKSDHIELRNLNINDPRIEKTKYGHIILPDKSGFGPIYFSSLQKRT